MALHLLSDTKDSHKKGFGFKTYYEEKKETGKFLGRLPDSFIRSLDFQLAGSNNWMNAWNENVEDDEEVFSSFIEPYPDLLYCNSWMIPAGVYQVRIAEANRKNLHIFVHGLDLFSLSAMRGALEAEKENGVSIFNFNVEIIKSLSTEKNPCETNPIRYPDYMRGAARN